MNYGTGRLHVLKYLSIYKATGSAYWTELKRSINIKQYGKLSLGKQEINVLKFLATNSCIAHLQVIAQTFSQHSMNKTYKTIRCTFSSFSKSFFR